MEARNRGKTMLKEEDLNVLFLVETDTKSVKTPEEYRVEGFITVLPKREKNEDMVRMIALMDEETSKQAKIREDLMSSEFPSIWIEVERKKEKKNC